MQVDLRFALKGRFPIHSPSRCLRALTPKKHEEEDFPNQKGQLTPNFHLPIRQVRDVFQNLNVPALLSRERCTFDREIMGTS